jgi:hypothetical protein
MLYPVFLVGQLYTIHLVSTTDLLEEQFVPEFLFLLLKVNKQINSRCCDLVFDLCDSVFTKYNLCVQLGSLLGALFKYALFLKGKKLFSELRELCNHLFVHRTGKELLRCKFEIIKRH